MKEPMKERAKRLLRQVKYASSNKNRKWNGAKWEKIGTFFSATHSFLFVSALIKTGYNVKYTYKCAEFDFRFAFYICIINLMALWPIPDMEKERRLKNVEIKTKGKQEEEQNEKEDDQNDEEEGQQEVEKKRYEAFPNSENNQIVATIIVGATIVCYYFHLISTVDFVLLAAAHLFSAATKLVFFWYTEFCTNDREEEKDQKFPDLAATNPKRMAWYRIGYALRACLIVTTIIAFTKMPSLEDRCPIYPAPTFVSYAYLLCLLFICLGEHWDETCNWVNLYENVLNERQYIIVGKNASKCAVHNYFINIVGAFLFMGVSGVLFYFGLMTVCDMCIIGIGSSLWIIFYTLSSLCFTMFVNQAVKDFGKTAAEQSAEEGKADDVKEVSEIQKEDGRLLV